MQEDTLVLALAAQIAELSAASDAPLPRVIGAMGYEALAELREEVLADLTGSTAPLLRMQTTIDAAGSDPARLLAHLL